MHVSTLLTYLEHSTKSLLRNYLVKVMFSWIYKYDSVLHNKSAKKYNDKKKEELNILINWVFFFRWTESPQYEYLYLFHNSHAFSQIQYFAVLKNNSNKANLKSFFFQIKYYLRTCCIFYLHFKIHLNERSI